MNNKPFKKLRGNRVYLIMPEPPQSSLYLDETVKQLLMEQEMKSIDHLKVYAVGEIVTDIYEGDVVLVDRVAIAKAPIIKLEEKLSVICVSQFDIMHVWE